MLQTRAASFKFKIYALHFIINVFSFRFQSTSQPASHSVIHLQRLACLFHSFFFASSPSSKILFLISLLTEWLTDWLLLNVLIIVHLVLAIVRMRSVCPTCCLLLIKNVSNAATVFIPAFFHQILNFVLVARNVVVVFFFFFFCMFNGCLFWLWLLIVFHILSLISC